jgi:tetratricopeptide (TPR) repeat protein
MFVPLAWAAGFAMTYPSLCRRAPRIALAMLVAVLAMFGYMVHENRSYYVVESRGFDEVIRDYSVARVWSHLRPGVTYCGVGVEPYGILFTGPTLHEFSIVDRKSRDTCPTGSIEISPNHPPGTQLADDSRELFAAGRYAEAADAARQAIAIDPTNDILAWKIECAALARLERWAEAVPSCERAVALHTNGSTANLALARAHLAQP